MVDEKKNLRYLVRIANTDLDGSKPMHLALTKIKGVGHSFSNAICHEAGIDKFVLVGSLSDDEVRKVNDLIKIIAGKVPEWMLNRRKEIETGQSQHLTGADLQFARENEIRRMKMIRSYKGRRHASGLPVRGQRTRSNFRRNKGKGLGVIKKKVRQQMAGKEEESKKGK